MPTPTEVADEHAFVQAVKSMLQSYIDGNHDTKATVSDRDWKLLMDAVSSGYRVWPGHELRRKPYTANPFFLQKRILNERGDTLYFVCLEFWDLGREIPQYDHAVSLSPSVQFHVGSRRGANSRTVNVSPFCTEEDTLQNIEAFFAAFYNSMGCVPYETAEER